MSSKSLLYLLVGVLVIGTIACIYTYYKNPAKSATHTDEMSHVTHDDQASTAHKKRST